MNFPPEEVLAKLRNPPPRMKVWLDGGDRFHTMLLLLSMYNPDTSSIELSHTAVELLEGSTDYPSLKGIYP